MIHVRDGEVLALLHLAISVSALDQVIDVSRDQRSPRKVFRSIK